jgi:hypothetical protein
MLLTYFLKYIKLENNPLKRAKIKTWGIFIKSTKQLSAKYLDKQMLGLTTLWSTLSDAQQLNKAD